MALNKLKLPTIRLGASVDIPIRVETDALTFAAIASISRAAPARIVTTDPHGVLDGWRCAVVDAKGMTDINAASSRHPISDKDMHVVSVIDSTTLDMLGVSSLSFRAHTANTGAVAFYAPKDLTGYTARMSIKDKIGGSVLHSLTTENNGIDIDPTAKTITLSIPAADTEDFTWSRGVYDLEMVSPAGKVTRIISGRIALSREVTT